MCVERYRTWRHEESVWFCADRLSSKWTNQLIQEIYIIYKLTLDYIEQCCMRSPYSYRIKQWHAPTNYDLIPLSRCIQPKVNPPSGANSPPTFSRSVLGTLLPTRMYRALIVWLVRCTAFISAGLLLLLYFCNIFEYCCGGEDIAKHCTILTANFTLL